MPLISCAERRASCIASYQTIKASRKVAMKRSRESISTSNESTTMALPRGFQSASSSAVAPGMLRVRTKRAITPSRNAAARFGCRL